MPGRYSLTDPKATMELLFGVECPAERPLHNIAPTWYVPVVRHAASGGLEAVMMRWGLVPRWVRKITEGAKLHNARCETLAEKRTFRGPFAKRRCLLPLDSFFVWYEHEKQKVPYRISLTGGRPFACAGLWERWTAPGHEESAEGGMLSCTLVTTATMSALAHLDSRMPVILDPADHAAWLDLGASAVDLDVLLRPCPAERLALHEVSARVNSHVNDDPACLDPLRTLFDHGLDGA